MAKCWESLDMAMESKYIKMVFMKDTGLITEHMGMAHSMIKMAITIQAPGRTISRTASAFTNMRMETFMKEILLMNKETAKGARPGLMALAISDNLRMELNMA